MANRAYLYPSNQPDQWEWDRNETEYYDSRHSFPMLWWLLVSALQRFKNRIKVHNDRLLPYISLAELNRFLDRVSQWGSEYLIIDPSDVFQDDAEIDHPEILQFIDSLDESLEFSKAPYGSDSKDEVKLIGYTYI